MRDHARNIASLLFTILSLGIVPFSYAQTEADTVYTIVDQNPELNGGLAALWQQVRYPESARTAAVRGKVYVQVVVDTMGAVRNAVVLKSLEPGCDAEALRVVEQATFTPGLLKGKPVNVQQTLLIRCEPNVLAAVGPPRITALQTEPLYPLTNNPVHFTAIVQGRKPFSFAWDFGDGSTDTTANPTHTFRSAVMHLVTLEVSNRVGIARDTLALYLGVGPRVYATAEEMPELIGGLVGLQRKIRYPEEARKAGIEGRVILQFIVDENGDVQDLKVVRGIGSACDWEALRVVKTARFRPGKEDGKPVKVKMSLPITFRLKD